MRLLWLAPLLTLAKVKASPPLSISLETGWPAPPLLLEILETVYDEDPTAYFSFLRLVLTHLSDFDTAPEQILSTSLDLIVSQQILPQPSALSTLNYALSLHTAVPRIEAAYSWYEGNVNESTLGVAQCENWVEWRGKGFCDVDGLRRDVEMSIEDGSHPSIFELPTLPFDHISESRQSGPRAVFYFSPEVSASPLLDYLDKHASAYPSFQYMVRYRPSTRQKAGRKSGDSTRTPLSGFGVELALKKTDYLVVDDRATGSAPSIARQATGCSVNATGIFSDVLGTDPWSELASPLTPAEVREIGLKTTALIMGSSDPLAALQNVAQDFPKYSAAIARKVVVPQGITYKAMDLQRRGPEAPGIYINGKVFRDAELNAYSLLKTIREERQLALSLISLGLTPKQAVDMISDPVIGRFQTDEDPGEGVVDSSDREEGGGVVIWWNDVEKDKRYKSWPTSLNGFLRPMYPGQLHNIRRNAWNLIHVVDLSLVSSLETITGQISMMIQRNIPIRFGIVPMFDIDSQDISTQMARIYYYSVQTYGRGPFNQFMSELIAATPSTPSSPGTVKLEAVRFLYERMASASGKAGLPFDQIIASDFQSDKLENASRYMRRLAATRSESPLGHLFINGKYTSMAGPWMSVVQNELTVQLGSLQEAIAAGMDVPDISTFFYDLPSVPKRRNKLIVPTQGENSLRVFNLLEVFSSPAAKLLSTDFLYTSDVQRGAPITTWIIGDLDSTDGRNIIVDALEHLQTSNCASRIGFIHTPAEGNQSPGPRLSTLIYQLVSKKLLHTITAQNLLETIRELDAQDDGVIPIGKITAESRTDGSQKILQGDVRNSPLNAFSTGWDVADIALAAEFWSIGSTVAEKLGLRTTSPHLLVNGRLVGPVSRDSFTTEDFDTLEAYEHRKRVKPIIDLLQTVYHDLHTFDRATLAHLISSASSVMAAAYRSGAEDSIFMTPRVSRSRYYETLDNGDMSFTIGNPDVALIRVAAVLDPVSEQAQRWSALLKTLSEMENVAVSVYLEPDLAMKELKLKRFYRTSLSSTLRFDIDGNHIDPSVTFSGLPGEPIFTLGIDTPPAWIVSPKTSPYDLDNLVLGAINEPIHVLFELKQLLIEGHAREANNAPPRGLQLQLTRSGLGVVSDTLIMANVGYLQFKVTPGVYDIAIRPGRGQEVYEMESTGTKGWDSPFLNETGSVVSLTSFEGMTILPRFKRKRGMEVADVLQASEVNQGGGMMGGVLSRVKSLIGLNTGVDALISKTRQADINIFTVASGLLYERFASIMILSVMKHTNSSVKFWFIENFLSPSFLAFIPHLAKEYGFQYELVTYKWPHWLRAQTEKQRIIWAYKILFLDVLFPMDLDKVIFVDADQIVRTDMKELVDLDLQGHVYGMAPMGNDRPEIEGFRFWKTGYWKDALRGKPYHISALYVVDLKRFRQLATGDRLRGQYHALSADPNSLANLDQDLPNSMQEQIPIFTLDRDWLWCQTWCSDESLARAKTIDLCQNPMTKEPKLVRARQIPEWDVYDREIAAFAASLASAQGDGGVGGGGGAMARGVDDLAEPAVVQDASGGGDVLERVVDEL